MRKKPFHLNVFDKMPIGDDTMVVDSNTCATDGDSDYFDSDDPGVYDSDISEDELMVTEDAVRRKTTYPVFDPKNVIPIFDIGMRFKNCEEFKEAIRTYSIRKGCVLEWLKNDRDCQRLQCTGALCK
ncbi:hypothetical protein SLA2020_176780 [Shorea laevis]